MLHGLKVGSMDLDVTTCPFLQPSSVTPFRCPFYQSMDEYGFSAEGLEHLETYDHKNKPACKDGNACEAFVRNNAWAMRTEEDIFEDACHMQLFSHPPRVRLESLDPSQSPFACAQKLEKKGLITNVQLSPRPRVSHSQINHGESCL